jgi:hypothetical protein
MPRQQTGTTTTRTRADGAAATHLRFRLIQLEPWCKGMAPPDGVGTREHPYRGELHLRAGEGNSDSPVLAVLQPDTEGRVELDLPGDRPVCALTLDKLQPREAWILAQTAGRPGAQLDPACLAEMWASCTVRIDPRALAAQEDPILTIAGRCGWSVPCDMNPTAPPPSAAPGR